MLFYFSESLNYKSFMKKILMVATYVKLQWGIDLMYDNTT